MDYNRLTGPQRKVMRGAIASVFPDRQDFAAFLEDEGFDPFANVVDESNYENQLFQFVRRYAARGKLGPLVGAMHREYPGSPGIADLDARLALVGANVESQRIAQEKGGLERMVRGSGEADLYLWADKLLQRGRQICRIRYPTGDGPLYGTGFLIGPDLVLTNYHVMEPLFQEKAAADMVRLRFDYAERAEARDDGVEYRLATDWRCQESRYSEADLAVDAGLPAPGELDFAIVRLSESAGATVIETGAPRGWVDLEDLPDPPLESDIVIVLQHPEGQPIKNAFGIVMKSPTELRLRYDADTDSGSSGALVLDSALRPLALHHAGDPEFKIKARYNQGIPLGLIHQALNGQAGA